MLDEKNCDKVRIDIKDMIEISVLVNCYIEEDSCNVIIVASQQLIELVNEDIELQKIVEEADLILPGANVNLEELGYTNVNEEECLEVESIEANDEPLSNTNVVELVDSEVVEELTKKIQKEIRAMILTDTEKSNVDFEEKISREFPKIKYAGCCFTDDGSEEDDVINQINMIAPDILCCMLKTPFQEEWVIKNKSKINAKLCILIGGDLEDVMIKKNKNNKWLYKLGLGKIYEKIFL